MKIPRYSGRNRFAINMTPMIDVVFLLIIFFLVSSHLSRRENELQLDLPSASSGEDVIDETTARVTLNILGDGQLMLAGSPVQKTELSQRLSVARQDEGQDFEVRIRADRTVAYEHVSPVLSAAASSGIWNVTFSGLRQESQR